MLRNRRFDTSAMGRWSQRDEVTRMVPFAVVAIGGQISAALPVRPQHWNDFWLSGLLLVATALSLVLSGPWFRRETTLLSAATYLASVALLMLANGGTSIGLGSLLLIPVVAVALYGRPWMWSLVVPGAGLALFLVSFLTSTNNAITTRRALLFTVLAAMIALSILFLRKRLVEANLQTRRLLEQAQAINAAAQQLTSLLDPAAIIALGVELAARIASTGGSTHYRALYWQAGANRVVADTSFDPGGDGEPWPVDDDPFLRQAAISRDPVLGVVHTADTAPAWRAAMGHCGVTHGAWVPVLPEGNLHGVLVIASGGTTMPVEALNRCVALGQLLQLALSNWLAHERLERQATAEERRRIARELHDGLAHELAYIASQTHQSVRNGTSLLDVQELAGAADRALDEARRAITVLSARTPQSLVQAITQTTEDLGARLKVDVELNLSDDIEMPGEVTEHLLRILREAVTNAATHGSPSRVFVGLQNGNGVHFVIEDDGCGFDAANLPPLRRGFGLRSMEERAVSVGARLTLDTAPGRGTRVRVDFP